MRRQEIDYTKQMNSLEIYKEREMANLEVCEAKIELNYKNINMYMFILMVDMDDMYYVMHIFLPVCTVYM